MDLGGMEKDYRAEGGFVPIGGKEKADDVPARLSKNEFVFTADAVRNAGGGDIDAGAEVMQNMMDNLEAGGEISEESQGAQGMYNKCNNYNQGWHNGITRIFRRHSKRLRQTGNGCLLVPIDTSKFTGQQFVAGEDPLQTSAINLAQQGVGSYTPYLSAAQAGTDDNCRRLIWQQHEQRQED